MTEKITITLPYYNEVEFTFEALPEDLPVKGNACFIDPETDEKIENEIIKRLNEGDLSAWFCATITASFRGITTTEYLGCCSYASLDDFETDPYYIEMMKQAAFESLLEEIRSLSD